MSMSSNLVNSANSFIRDSIKEITAKDFEKDKCTSIHNEENGLRDVEEKYIRLLCVWCWCWERGRGALGQFRLLIQLIAVRLEKRLRLS